MSIAPTCDVILFSGDFSESIAPCHDNNKRK